MNMQKVTVSFFNSTRIGIAILFFFVTATAQAGVFERLFVPKPELWQVWTQHDEESKKIISHELWNDFLQKYVRKSKDGINRLAYSEVTEEDKALLKSYILASGAVPIAEYNKAQQLAFWVNLYNATTVNIVLQHYPVNSIRDIDISPGLFSNGPWDKKILTIAGEFVSLNDIEHRILRPIWKDARLHYVLNCASLGCPNLLNHAYSADNMNNMLEMAAYDFINHPRGVTIDNDEIVVSSIYSWYQEDFGNSERKVLAHIRSYAKPQLADKLRDAAFFSRDDYDWQLNDTRVNE